MNRCGFGSAEPDEEVEDGEGMKRAHGFRGYL